MINFKQLEVCIVKKIRPKDGRLPIPRRDHSAAFIKDKKFIVVFGGRNDNSNDLDS